MSDHQVVTRVTDVELEVILLERDEWLLVAFTSVDSIPCDHFRPELVKLAAALPGVACFEIQADENPSICAEMKVACVPTTLLMKELNEIRRYEGPYTVEALVTRVTEAMKTPPTKE